MVNGTLAATLDVPSPRLSPKVRRLLREHGVGAEDVVGTGAAGRLTPADVLRATGGRPATTPARHPGHARPVLASPLARRLLREAGLTLDDVPSIPANNPVTRDVVARVLGGSDPSSGQAVGPRVVDLDLTHLLVAIAASSDEVRRRTGVALPLLAPVALATCRALRRHPELGSDGLAVAVPSGDGTTAATIPAALDLTVTALAERIAGLAGGGATDEVAGDAGGSAFVLTDAAWVGAAASAAPPGLVLGAPEERTVEVTDSLGLTATATRWMTSLRLTAPTADGAAASAFLSTLQHELQRPDLLSDIA